MGNFRWWQISWWHWVTMWRWDRRGNLLSRYSCHLWGHHRSLWHSVIWILPCSWWWLIITLAWRRHHIRRRLIITTILLSIVIHRRRLIVIHWWRICICGWGMHISWTCYIMIRVMVPATSSTIVMTTTSVVRWS